MWYEYTDGYAFGTFVIAEKQNKVAIVSSSVAVGDTGLMTAPVNEGAKSTLGATVVAVVGAVVAAAAVVFAKRSVRR